MNEQISYQTIIAAKQGDEDALKTIVRHYKPFIASMSKRTFYDRYGNAYSLIDNSICQQIMQKLMMEIIYHFDPTKLPEGETLESK